jgi:hypothetical protein
MGASTALLESLMTELASRRATVRVAWEVDTGPLTILSMTMPALHPYVKPVPTAVIGHAICKLFEPLTTEHAPQVTEFAEDAQPVQAAAFTLTALLCTYPVGKVTVNMSFAAAARRNVTSNVQVDVAEVTVDELKAVAEVINPEVVGEIVAAAFVPCIWYAELSSKAVKIPLVE